MYAPASLETVATEALAHPQLGAVTAWRVGNRVGESPVWSQPEAALYWIDVRAPQLLRLDPATRALKRWQLPEVVGAVALRRDATAWLALRHRVAVLDLRTDVLTDVADVEPHLPGNRLNDGKASPTGRWFVFGSMDDRPVKEAAGALYAMSTGGQVRQLFSGLVVANGIAWGPDASVLYFSDSARGLLLAAAWNEQTGTMGPPRLLATFTDAQGRPDGACIDARGDYWSAGVSAGVLNCVDASGRLLRQIAMPCRAPTMCSFGGAQAGQMFVTSLVRPQWDAPGPLEGALFSFNAPAPGRLGTMLD